MGFAHDRMTCTAQNVRAGDTKWPLERHTRAVVYLGHLGNDICGQPRHAFLTPLRSDMYGGKQTAT